VRTYQFADGLHIVWAAPALSDLLGARIDAIDGRSIAAIHVATRRYAGGTDAHRHRMLTAMLESPALLQAAGLATSRDSVSLRGVLANGTAFERTIQAEERDRSAWVSSSQRLLFPAWEGAPMVSLINDGDALPVYLRHRSELFSLEALPEGGLYVGLAHNGDTDDLPIATFLDRVLTRVRAEHPAFVVIDLRMNGGGDYTTTYAFAHAMDVLSCDNHHRRTQTAGGDQVIIVGEPVGDRLDFWAEGGTFNLPNAFLQVPLRSSGSERHVKERLRQVLATSLRRRGLRHTRRAREFSARALRRLLAPMLASASSAADRASLARSAARHWRRKRPRLAAASRGKIASRASAHPAAPLRSNGWRRPSP
jgi:hypothetical protein